MKEIVDRDLPINREVWSKEDAIAHFKGIGEDYKAQIIDDIIPPGEAITLYSHGGVWSDLCRGPHLPSTGKLPKAFKLMKLATVAITKRNNASTAANYPVLGDNDHQRSARDTRNIHKSLLSTFSLNAV